MIYPVLNIVNGCVLFPHMPDWGTKPVPRRIWETNIAEGIRGNEARAAMRAVPRRQISFMVTAQSLEERVRLEARMDMAISTGFACAPLHGRSSALLKAVAAGAQKTILLSTGGGWRWQAGDYAMLINNDLCYDIAAVLSTGLTADSSEWTADEDIPINQPALNLGSPLNFAWQAGALVWPVIFGKATLSKSDGLSGALSAVKITVSELTSGRNEQIGVLPAQGPGVGQQVIGVTNAIP